jgi:hypothetical protein
MVFQGCPQRGQRQFLTCTFHHKIEICSAIQSDLQLLLTYGMMKSKGQAGRINLAVMVVYWRSFINTDGQRTIC